MICELDCTIGWNTRQVFVLQLFQLCYNLFMPICNSCNEDRDESMFRPGHRICKICKSAQVKAYNAARAEERREQRRRWREANKEHRSRYQAAYREVYNPQHREEIALAKHLACNKRRAQCHLSGSFTVDQWLALVAFYCPDGRCLCCGRNEKLTKDHVIPLCKDGSNTIGNMQPLCNRCNGRKRADAIDYRPDNGAFARSLEENAQYELRR